jgi:hypothetical protein
MARIDWLDAPTPDALAQAAAAAQA